jgi:hypothetical protein
MAGVLQHLRSSTLNKRPNPASMVDGQLAINYASGSPGAFFKDSNGNLVKVGPVHVGATAPNVSPASGGTAGNSLGTYVFKIWDGAAWRSEAGEFVNVTGDTMTGALGVIAGSASTPGLFFSGDANSGLYSPGADQVAISTGGSGRLFVDASGRLGVGTSSPSDTLQINKTGAGGVKVVSTTQSTIYFSNATETGGYLIGRSIGSDNAHNLFSYDVTNSHYVDYFEGGSGGYRSFYTNGAERLRITSAGLVGVGTSSPLTKLDVRSGVITAGSSSSPDGTEILRGYYSATDGALAVIGTEYSSGGIVIGSAVKPSTSASDAFLSSTTVNVARGAYTIAGNTHKWYIGAVQTVAENSSVSTSEVMRIDSSGRVGIGATTVNTTLEVLNSSTPIIRVGDGTRHVQLWGGSSTQNQAVGTATSAAFNININSSPVATFDTSGRLLVGTSSSSAEAKFIVQGGDTAAGGAINIQRNATTASAGSTIGFINFANSANNVGATISADGDGTWSAGTSHPTLLKFSTTADGASSPTERLRITQAGHVFVGNVTGDYNTVGISLFSNGNLQAVTNQIPTLVLNRKGSDGVIVDFYRDTNNPGTISVTTTATSYNTSSDYRLKENVTPVTDGITRLQQLKPSRFNFIAAPGCTVDGFIAHEVQSVVPEAITGEKDAVDADGKPQYQGIDQSKLVPLLTAALQETLAKIESLEARLTAAGI